MRQRHACRRVLLAGNCMGAALKGPRSKGQPGTSLTVRMHRRSMRDDRSRWRTGREALLLLTGRTANAAVTRIRP